MKKLYWIITISLFIIPFTSQGTAAIATADTTIPGRMLSFKDSLYVEISGYNQRFLIHHLKPGQTLYGLSKYYSISTGDLTYYNPEITNGNDLKVGQPIRIPISLSMIMRDNDETTRTRWKVVPVYYRVRPGEALFGIARRHFDMPIDTLMVRNDMYSYSLDPGQLLLVGWFDVKGIDPSQRAYNGLSGVLKEVNRKLGIEYRNQSQRPKARAQYQKGIATWTKNAPKQSNLYALHRTAPIGTILQLKNPMSGRKIYVKVIGKLPPNGYDHDVIVYLPPAVVSALGALDRRFVVEVRWWG